MAWRVFKTAAHTKTPAWNLETQDWLITWRWVRPHWLRYHRVDWMRSRSIGPLSWTRL